MAGMLLLRSGLCSTWSWGPVRAARALSCELLSLALLLGLFSLQLTGWVAPLCVQILLCCSRWLRV